MISVYKIIDNDILPMDKVPTIKFRR